MKKIKLVNCVLKQEVIDFMLERLGWVLRTYRLEKLVDGYYNLHLFIEGMVSCSDMEMFRNVYGIPILISACSPDTLEIYAYQVKADCLKKMMEEIQW